VRVAGSSALVGLPRRHLGPLLEQIERSDRTVRQAKRELMEANLRLVVSVAKRYLGSGPDASRPVQEGNIGLMKAVDRFQYRRRVQVLDVRDLVDSPGHHPGDRRPFAHDPDSGPHGRDVEPNLRR